MEFLSVLHGRLPSAILVFALACAVWRVWGLWRGQAALGNYWGALVVGAVLVIVQGLAGLIMLIAGEHPAHSVHPLYGVLAALAWPTAYVYAQGRGARRESLVHGVASFLIIVFAVRATMTA